MFEIAEFEAVIYATNNDILLKVNGYRVGKDGQPYGEPVCLGYPEPSPPPPEPEPMSNDTATPATQRRRRTWYGCFAVENMDEITDRIRNLIGAGQPYTFVANNVAHTHSHPDVRTSQQVDTHNGNPITAKVSELDNGTPFAHIFVSDSYGVWGISTTHQTRADAETARQRRQEPHVRDDRRRRRRVRCRWPRPHRDHPNQRLRGNPPLGDRPRTPPHRRRGLTAMTIIRITDDNGDDYTATDHHGWEIRTDDGARIGYLERSGTDRVGTFTTDGHQINFDVEGVYEACTGRSSPSTGRSN